MAVVLLIIGVTGAVKVLGRFIPQSVVRGVQLATGILLMAQGVRFMLGTSKLQSLHQLAEPYLRLQQIGPLPVGIVLGVGGGMVTLLLLENRRLPAGLVVVLGGLATGLIFGRHTGFQQLQPGFFLPALLPFGWPSGSDVSFALLALVLPQVPMTLGNAVVANADLSAEYFGPASRKVTYSALAISMGLANLASFGLGGMPLCHGAGGLAAHYRFGARTAGSNLMIGALFLALALFLGRHALALVYLIPMAVLGVLLLFSGGQLALTIIDLKHRKDLFVALTMLGITLAANLAAGFLVGIAAAYALKSDRLKV